MLKLTHIDSERSADPLSWWKNKDSSKPWVDKVMTGRLQWPHPFPLRVFSKTGQIITEKINCVSTS
jgi:hypothetical protein